MMQRCVYLGVTSLGPTPLGAVALLSTVAAFVFIYRAFVTDSESQKEDPLTV